MNLEPVEDQGAQRQRASARKYYLRNKDKVIARSKKWAEENRGKVKKIRAKGNLTHREKREQYQLTYRKERPLKYLVSLASRRSKRRGTEFSITSSNLTLPEVCPLLGIKIDPYSKIADFRPSLDRIDNSKGYIPGNVVVVSYRANRLKNNSNGRELLLLAHNLLKMEGGLL